MLAHLKMTQVLLHSLIDWMRTDEEEEEGREINHHGKSITVGGIEDTDTVPHVEAVLKLKILLLSLNFFAAAEHESWTKQRDEATIHRQNQQE